MFTKSCKVAVHKMICNSMVFYRPAMTKKKIKLIHPSNKMPRIRKFKEPRIAKIPRERKIGGLELSDFKTYCKATDRHKISGV